MAKQTTKDFSDLTVDVMVAATRYGNLARVAMQFYVTTGNLAELDAAVLYARVAGRLGNALVDTFVGVR